MLQSDRRYVDLVRVLQREEIFLLPSPFRKAAELLGWEVGEVLERSRRLKDAGIIRRFGAALTPGNAGFKSNSMVAWQAGAEPDGAARIMAAHPRISHCYIRPAFEGFPYNLYTMIHGESPEDLKSIIDELRASSGIESFRALNTLKEFKKSSPVYFPSR
ncbi:MAG: Lrp/AsnC family transcriptional regulator [Deltaproteobacteria bacterium]|nr:Lrp/AsnC family transcriptional regulator [Deltaproteobacteria bacterium]